MGTLPVGPKERGDWWYANSRLAYSCLGIVAWGPVMGGHDQAAKTCYFSRVTSKKAECTVACVTDFFRGAAVFDRHGRSLLDGLR